MKSHEIVKELRTAAPSKDAIYEAAWILENQHNQFVESKQKRDFQITIVGMTFLLMVFGIIVMQLL